MTKEELIIYLCEGNDPRDLAKLYLSKLTAQELKDLEKEVEDCNDNS